MTPIYNPPPPITDWHAAHFADVLAALLAQREPVYVVGGAVRDFLMGREAGTTDLDLALTGPVLPVARRVADVLGWAYYPLDEERDVARIVLARDDGPPLVCDLAGLRGGLESDLALRDFTVNAMALELHRDRTPALIDLWGGADDLAAGRIRTVSPTSLTADPVRLLRAVRFAGQLGFAIDPETETQIVALAAQVSTVSAERQRDELWKILALDLPGDQMAELHRLGLLVHLLPEAAGLDRIAQSPPHTLDVFRHTVQVMNYAAALRNWLRGDSNALPEEGLETALGPWREKLTAHFAEELSAGHDRAGWLVWHALFHDTGKPGAFSEEIDPEGKRRIRFFGHEEISAALAAERGTALRFSRREVQVAQTVAAAHMRPHHLSDSFPNGRISRRAAYRFLRDTATGGRSDRTGLDVLMLAVADRQAPGKARGGNWRAYLAGISAVVELAFAPVSAGGPPLVDGKTLMRALELPPGRTVGFLLESIAEARAAGEITDPEDALALAADLLAQRAETDL